MYRSEIWLGLVSDRNWLYVFLLQMNHIWWWLSTLDAYALVFIFPFEFDVGLALGLTLVIFGFACVLNIRVCTFSTLRKLFGFSCEGKDCGIQVSAKNFGCHKIRVLVSNSNWSRTYEHMVAFEIIIAIFASYWEHII